MAIKLKSKIPNYSKVKCSWGIGRVLSSENGSYEIRLDQPTWVFGKYTERCSDMRRDIEILEIWNSEESATVDPTDTAPEKKNVLKLGNTMLEIPMEKEYTTYPMATIVPMILTDGSTVYNVAILEDADASPIPIEMDSQEASEQLIELLQNHSNLFIEV